MTKLLETIDLVTNFYTYEGVVKALNRVSLVIDHGSTFGLVGESGCGKSVTARSIMRIVQDPGRIEDGKIIVYLDDRTRDKGIDLLKQSEAYMQGLRGDRISMIFQEPNSALNPTMSIGEQVSESYLFHQQKEMSVRILAQLESPPSNSLNPLNKFLQTVYRISANNPSDLRLRILKWLPLIKLWQSRLKKEARRRSVEIIEKLGKHKKINVAGCATCVAECHSGGQKEVEILASQLRIAFAERNIPIEISECCRTNYIRTSFLQAGSGILNAYPHYGIKSFWSFIKGHGCHYRCLQRYCFGCFYGPVCFKF